MSVQYDICRLRVGSAERSLVIILQHDHVSVVYTRVVVPLVPEGQMKRVARLHPLIDYAGQRMIVAVDLVAAIPANTIGPAEASAAHLRDEITAALDLLFTGF